MPSLLKLGVNIDHVATVRQARYAHNPQAFNAEPSILQAAEACCEAGAQGITVHLREDRRHIIDEDVVALRKHLSIKLNLEMANTQEMVEMALKISPDEVCLVPEKRQEITTEGGLDVVGHIGVLRETVKKLQGEGIRVSVFIDPHIPHIEAAQDLRVEIVELHTGAFANAEKEEKKEEELERLIRGARLAHREGIQVNAGHGINYSNIEEIKRIPHLQELNIGHSIVSRALFVGIKQAVREMLEKMR